MPPLNNPDSTLKTILDEAKNNKIDLSSIRITEDGIVLDRETMVDKNIGLFRQAIQGVTPNKSFETPSIRKRVFPESPIGFSLKYTAWPAD